MADISTEIEAFRSAERGEQVRSSMISAIEKINEEVEYAVEHQIITVDTTLTESGQGAEAKAVGDAINELRSEIDQKGESVEIKVQGTTLVINTDLVNGNEVSY